MKNLIQPLGVVEFINGLNSLVEKALNRLKMRVNGFNSTVGSS